MNDLIKLSPCPLCGSTTAQRVERSMYTSDGKFIHGEKNRHQWIVRCENCFAITENSHSRIHAISRWNRGELTDASWELSTSDYTHDPEPWWNLATAIYKVAFEDYKEALRRKRETGGRGAIEGEHWLIKQSTAAKRAAREQIPYDQWRDRMGCSHCTATEQECEHKFSYPWIKFKNGKAQDCFLSHDKEEEVPRTADGHIDWATYRRTHKDW